MKRTIIGLVVLGGLITASAYIIKSKARQATGESMSLDEAVKTLAELEGQRDAILEYNRIIETQVNEGHYAEGAAALEAFLDRAPEDMVERVHGDLALCYRALGDDPTLEADEAARWYARAREHDPDGLDARQRQVLERSGP